MLILYRNAGFVLRKPQYYSCIYVINVTRRFQRTIILRGFFSLFTFVSLPRLFRFKYSREARGVTLQASDLHRVWMSFLCLVLKYVNYYSEMIIIVDYARH